MILPLVALLLQTAQPPVTSPPEAKPVRVWLASSSPLLRGDAVRVYVQTVAHGYLVVLHRRTDGRIEVLFPGNPGDDPYVRPGTYEIRDAGNRESFVVTEPDGTGLILAALSPASYRFDEFVRAAAWDPDALVPSWSGADGEGALGDIVQRMLGDGYFNYDVVTYTVVPRPYAMQDTTSPYPSPAYGSCTDCTFIGYQQIVYEPFSVCDALFSPCLGVHRFPLRPPATRGICGIESPCLEHTSAIALALPRTGTDVRLPPRSRSFTNQDRSAPRPSAEPRARARERATPLGPGRRTAPLAGRPARAGLAARTRAVAAPVAPAASHEVRLTLSPTAPPPAVREDAPAAGEVRRGAGLVALPRGAAVAAPAVQRLVATVPRSRVSAGMPAPSPVQPARQVHAVGGTATTARMQGMALPGAGAARLVTGRRR